MQITSFNWPSGTYYFEQPWTLEGITYIFTMRFNLRVQTWFMDIADISEKVLVAGIPLRANRDLIKQYGTYGLPKGVLYVYDTSGNDDDPGQDSFATTHSFNYITLGP